ncbi:hypothetical protein SKAU_G00308040 [Synaphobranchus kaupii]|uniref:SH2 domain-containing protein n=1 Tax=Synaphobranchus kaupii TaxID=118154 RepID=A0A9Q1ER53_SYNKA|nr:hypothetical protein SKAU_G00308040 [Synaphobranchus kaupii]
MAKWFKEHLGFKTTKAPPPAPPKPDYRHCLSAVSGNHQPSSAATCHYPSPAQPDILAAYKLQKEMDFEDPYTAGGNVSLSTGLSCLGSPDIKYVSPKHRLIKVETIEKSNSTPSSGVIAATTVTVSAVNVKSPTSPPAEQENKQEKLIILEDYADPFDAKQAGGTQATTEKVPENDGYMEPYEAQKMMAEIRGGWGPKDSSGRQQLPLLPQDDERPPEEYDQPWEWKKDRISKAFAALLCYDCISYEGTVPAIGSDSQKRKEDCVNKPHKVQFDGVEKPQVSPPKEGKARLSQRHSSGCLVNTKLGSLDHCSPTLGERIDPSLPLESQFWYHGAISRIDAESLLRLCKEASYLVRNSETSKNDFSLSLKSSQGFMHMKLSRTKDSKYVLGQNSCPFDSVPEIIHFYSSRKLPIKGAEHMSLLYPVAIRTL